MGFMDFINSIGNGIKEGFNKINDKVFKPVGHWISGAAQTVYHKVILPVGEKAGQVFNKFAGMYEKGYYAVGNLASKIPGMAEKVVDTGTSAFSNLTSMPMLLLGGMAGLMLLSRR
jgi:hypothetical protein